MDGKIFSIVYLAPSIENIRREAGFVDDDGRMQKFIENSDKLEVHIDGVLNMLCGRGMWLRKSIIYEDLNETCSQNYIEKVMSTVKHAMDLYDIRSAMVGEDVR